MSKTILAERRPSDLLIVWAAPLEGRKAGDADGPRLHGMVFYAVVSDEIHRVIEFFRTRRDAELILARVLREEDGLRQAPAG